MHPANLLIVDGESFRTSDLSTVMAKEGWEVAWARGSSGLEGLKGFRPDVVLFDPALMGQDGLALLKKLQASDAGLPLVGLGGTEFEAWAAKAGLEPGALHKMGRDISFLAWPATLRSCLGGFGPGAQKFTTEDLFGDILAEMDEALPPAPAPPVLRAAVPPPPQAFVPPEPPEPVEPPKPPGPPEPIELLELLEPLEPMALPATELPESPRTSTLSSLFGASDSFTLAEANLKFGSSDSFRLAETDVKATGPLPTINQPWPPPSVAAAPEPAMESMEEFGNYYLLEKVAVGGMAELFKARQRGVHDFEKIVAIKRILPHLSDNDEFVRMFIDEAKLAAQLTHPNIVQIFDLGKAMGFYYIAMEFVDGRDLRSLLRKVREYRLPVPEPIAAAVTMKMASALDYAHRKRGINDKELRLVHRDISPQNILISYEGAVKLVDFGIAKAATKSTQTMAGALKGKLLYMSPEQALGQPLDGRSDIYSLGLVLFELLTGERCFQADSELGVLEKVRLGKVSDVRVVNPSVSQDLADVVAKALNKEVEQRYVSARFLERDLKNLMVRNHNEPNEHDLAEYVNTVLKGTRVELETLLKLRYPPLQRPALPQVAQPSAPLAPAPAPAALPARPVAPAPRPLPPPEGVPPASQPLWLIPVVIFVIALVAFVALRLFK